MGRRPRILVAGGIYRVYNRVAHGKPALSDRDEAADIIGTIHETKKRDS